MKKLAVSLAVFLFFAHTAHAEPLPVVASFSILGDMVREVGGSDVTVTTLVGPNADAHAFEPTPENVRTVAHTKLLIVNGLGFEGWLPRLTSAAAYKGDILVASKTITARTMEDEDHPGVTVTDPHAWQNLGNGITYVHNIETALAAAMPDKTAQLHQRAEAYIAKINAMQEKLRTQIAAVPENKRHIITSHDAFGYFGAAYGIRFMAPAGLSTESEPTAAHIAKLVKQMRAEHVKTIFLENMASPHLAKQLAQEVHGQIGGTLYADALSAPDGAAPTYLKMFENNLPLLLKAMAE